MSNDLFCNTWWKVLFHMTRHFFQLSSFLLKAKQFVFLYCVYSFKINVRLTHFSHQRVTGVRYYNSLIGLNERLSERCAFCERASLSFAVEILERDLDVTDFPSSKI